MISIENVKKSYGKTEILKDVTLSLKEGECYGLVGPNGAGKSTMMKILSGIITDYDGKITCFNDSLKSSKGKIQAKMGYVPQDICLEETLSAEDNLHFFGQLYGIKGARLRKRTDDILRLVGLSDRKRQAVKQFSGGMKRRINIGCALVHDPDFIILDEPTVGIDPQSRNLIFELILSLKEKGKTILYSSHYMEEVEHLCDAIAILDHGSVLEQGTLDDIVKRNAKLAVFVSADGIALSDLVAFGTVSAKGSGFLVESIDPFQALVSISTTLQEKGCFVHRLEIARPSLEEIFLALTGRALRD